MQNFVRVLALALVASGAIASMHTNSAAAQATLSPRSSALPMPVCPPDDPNGCGICKWGNNCAR